MKRDVDGSESRPKATHAKLRPQMAAIIPQHGTSERLKNKALRPFCGLPLVAWTVIQCVAAKCIGDTYVSTDSDEVAKIGEQYGAKIIRRPDWLNDKRYAATAPIGHAVKHLGIQEQRMPFFPTLAMCPLKKPGDIDRLFDTYSAAPRPPAGILKQAVFAARTQESILYKDIPGKILRGQAVRADKSHDTIQIMGASPIEDLFEFSRAQERLEWWTGEAQVTDARADQDLIANWFISGSGVFYYAPVELWQTTEIDDGQSFDLCETLMEAYILRGKGAEVYE
jgi:CMP-N-acetylneuraminic acid synthetase